MTRATRAGLRAVGACAVAAELAACAVGPNFTPPAPAVPSVFAAAAGAPERVVSNDAADAEWWHAFHDPNLDRLESRTQQGNLDLQAGVLRIVAARTQVQAARAQGLPSLNATASYNHEQLGVAGILKSQGTNFGGAAINPALLSALTSPINLYQVGFDASWELDLFGKVSRSVEAAQARSDEAVEARHDMQVSLEAEVAQNYLQLRAAQLLRSITDHMIAEEHEILELTVDRRLHGLAQEADVESARAQEANLRAQLPQYDQNLALSRHALAVLLGEAPEALDGEFLEPADLPAMPAMIPVGLPSNLARRRPDVRQAEASLHAATAEIGVSMAALYPDVSLTGSFGLRNISANYLFDWASKFYSAGPAISLPLFHGGALVANVKMSRAQAASAALSYRKTVLGALQEVEDGLVSLDQDGRRLSALGDTVAADQRSFDITVRAYKAGLTSYLSVLTQEVQTNQAREQSAQASLTEVTDLVKLYKALGGGWETGSAEGAERGPNTTPAG